MTGRLDPLTSLIERIEAARARLDAAADAGEAVPALQELDALAQELAGEIDRRRRALADDDEGLAR